MPETQTSQHQRVLGSFSHTEGISIVCVAGVHGNEPAGIRACERVLDRLERERPDAFAGRLVAVVGNLEAVHAPDGPVRYIDTDLNRAFPRRGKQGRDENVESRERDHLMNLFYKERSIADGRLVVVDLHTVSSPSPPFVFVEDSLPARKLARRLGLPLVLGMEEEIHGLLVDWTTHALDAVSMLIEAGVHDDPSSVDTHEAALWMLLDATGVLPLDAIAHKVSPEQVLRDAAGSHRRWVCDVRHREPVGAGSFVVCDDMGAYTPVREAQSVVAHREGAPVLASSSGLVFMPNRHDDKRPEDDGYFIVRRIGPMWLGLSAVLRRQEWLHRLLRRMPGVDQHDNPDSLTVDTHVARFLRRQVLHLMGYRLLKHRDAHGGVGRVWVVTRHHLDTLDPPTGG
ncbi:MAG: succinylglutamate desuccinylase/aspartoacylase family protein [Phycisphaerales bacterium JB043]